MEDRDGRHDRDRSDRRRDDRSTRHDRASERDRDRARDRRRDRDRDRDRERDRERDRGSDRHFRDRDRDHDRGKERVRDRSRERSRERLKSRERESVRDRDHRVSGRENGSSRSVPREEAAVDHKRSRSNEPGLVDNGFADHDGLKKKQKVDEPDLPDLPPPPPAAAVEGGFDTDITPDEVQMMGMMGIPFGFLSTQGQHVDDEASNAGAVKAKEKRRARQYMNRRGGFNRPLPAERTGETARRD